MTKLSFGRMIWLHGPPPSRQQIVSLYPSSCVSPVQLCWRGEGAWSRIVRRKNAWASISRSILSVPSHSCGVLGSGHWRRNPTPLTTLSISYTYLTIRARNPYNGIIAFTTSTYRQYILYIQYVRHFCSSSLFLSLYSKQGNVVKSRLNKSTFFKTIFINTVLEDWGGGYTDFLRVNSICIHFPDFLYTHLY